MLKGWLERLTGSSGVTAADPSRLIILNHNPGAPREPGSTELFASTEALAGDIHAPDIATDAYFACDALGRVVTMTAMPGDTRQRITATVADHATDRNLAMRLIRHHLKRRIEDGIALDPRLVERESDVGKLVAMIPRPDIWG
jgi:hypothetical protein